MYVYQHERVFEKKIKERDEIEDEVG